MLKHASEHFRTHDGLELYAQHWLPAAPPRAALAVVHGFGEHSGRYSDVAAWFVSRGYAVYAFDHRGHGHSPGQRGHVNRWSEYRDDVRVFVKRMREQAVEIPLFLVGHSMGGLIVLDYALHYPQGLKGVVASGPALGRGEDVSAALLFVGKVLSYVIPRLKLESGLNAAGLSHDEEVVRAYRDDPLVHGHVTPRFAAQMDATMKRTMKAAPDWEADLPLLIVHGGDDPLCPPGASARFFERVGAADKTRHEYPGYLHEVFNEVGREKVLQDVQAWLEAHLD
ncbi:MAG: lysophospholipase [Anaerolineae bacterium]